MADLIIAFPKLDDAKNLRKLLVRNGYDVNMVCDSGAQIVGAVNELDGGIIISGYKFSDMHYSESGRIKKEAKCSAMIQQKSRL